VMQWAATSRRQRRLSITSALTQKAAVKRDTCLRRQLTQSGSMRLPNSFGHYRRGFYLRSFKLGY